MHAGIKHTFCGSPICRQGRVSAVMMVNYRILKVASATSIALPFRLVLAQEPSELGQLSTQESQRTSQFQTLSSPHGLPRKHLGLDNMAPRLPSTINYCESQSLTSACSQQSRINWCLPIFINGQVISLY